MARLILAIDQGTTNSKAVLFDETGQPVARGSRALATHFPRPGWVEQDAQEIWASVVGAVDDCLAASPGGEVIALGVSNQRESALAWDRWTGAPLGPCVTWQCSRSRDLCETLRRAGHAEAIEQATGLALDPMFSAGKMRWLLDAITDGRRRAAHGEVCLGTVDSWLIWKLTGGQAHATDASNASRTQLLDLSSGVWSPMLLELFGIPAAALPEIRASNTSFGEITATEFPVRAPILGVAGDSHAAMFGHAGFQPGTVKATYGTGSSLMTLAAQAALSNSASPAKAGAQVFPAESGLAEGGLNAVQTFIPGQNWVPTFVGMSGVENAATNGLSATVAWQLGDQLTLALEGNIASTGATLEWVGRMIGGAEDPAGRAAELAATVADAGGVYIVPAFAGLGAPHWDDQARGLICGLTRGSGPAQLARAAFESIAFQIADVFDAMQKAAGSPLAELRADGGPSRNDALMQFQSDMLQRPVVRDRSADLSALGAAYLAGLGAGLWDLAGIGALPRETDRFEPKMAADEARRLRDGWQAAIERARLRPEAGEGQG
ncbi:MAG: glycerol kinase [Caulobacteraceae bacterium]|nr:glycerol kinase [Caulobacteraceae bacterium]